MLFHSIHEVYKFVSQISRNSLLLCNIIICTRNNQNTNYRFVMIQQESWKMLHCYTAIFAFWWSSELNFILPPQTLHSCYGEPELVEHSKAACKSFNLTKGSLHSVKKGLCKVLKWSGGLMHISPTAVKSFEAGPMTLNYLWLRPISLWLLQLKSLVRTNVQYLVVH